MEPSRKLLAGGGDLTVEAPRAGHQNGNLQGSLTGEFLLLQPQASTSRAVKLWRLQSMLPVLRKYSDISKANRLEEYCLYFFKVQYPQHNLGVECRTDSSQPRLHGDISLYQSKA